MQNTNRETVTCCGGPDRHPGMVRLPVAPRINHRIRFAPLSADRENHITPLDAVRILVNLKEHGAQAQTVLLYGPGDPLADIDSALETISRVRSGFPEITVVVRTIGVDGVKFADKLSKAGVEEVEMPIDGVVPSVLENIYAWVRPGYKTLKLSEAVEILCGEQARSIQAFKDAGMKVHIITTLYPTVNDDHLEQLAKKVAEYGADDMTLHPYAPEPGADITLPAPDPADIDRLLAVIGEVLPVRKGRPATCLPATDAAAAGALPKPTKQRPNVAVVSTNGMDIDLHLGQAPQMLIYGPREDGLACLLESRPTPDPGIGDQRWNLLADSIPDCFALLTASAGDRPRRILSENGIQILISQEQIEGVVDSLYGGGKKKGKGKK